MLNMRPIRSTASALNVLLVCLTGVLGAGVPMDAGTDHDGGTVHLEVDHGGHGAKLIQQDDRLRGYAPALLIAVTATQPTDSEPEATRSSRPDTRVALPSSRAPPTTRSRAPPIL